MSVIVNCCKECGKPLYVDRYIEIFGFDTNLYCRSNIHFHTIKKVLKYSDSEKIHPTQKVALLKKLIEIFTDEGNVVIDPVAGIE